jgi:hypothetical protein
VNPPLDVAGLLRALEDGGVEFVLIGGLAVNAHGVIRSTKVVDICPAPGQDNLSRLAGLLRRLEVRRLGTGEEGFAAAELPFDPSRTEDLAEGGNFRLDTPLGMLDVMQWVPGIDSDQAYEHLAAHARIARSGSRSRSAHSRICAR